MSHRIYIKNMVCDRCKSSVSQILRNQNLPYADIKLGEVSLYQSLSEREKESLGRDLQNEGFELLEDKDSRLINKIKTEVIRFVHHQGEEMDENLSDFLVANLHREYSSISKLFSQVEGRTIENFYLDQRIEKAKELLIYDELSLSQIADILNYSSVAHLSAQFKKITGMTPTAFKKLGSEGRKELDEV